MGRIVAIAGGDLQSTFPISKYTVEMDPKSSHNLLFIGTASEDAEGYIDRVRDIFGQLDCSVKALCLCTKKYSDKEIDEMLEWADIIYVGGGNTARMMKVWNKYGLGDKLKEVYAKDSAILTGISAGAMCWFNCGHSDSEDFWINDVVGYGWVEGLLNIHPYIYCPHYEDRTESFDKMILEKSMDSIAMESDTSFVEQNGEIKYIRCKDGAKAYMISHVNGTLIKKEIETERIS